MLADVRRHSHRTLQVPVPHGKKVWVDEYMLDTLKDLLGLDGDAEARSRRLEARRLAPSIDVDVLPYRSYGSPYEDDTQH